MKNLFLFIFTCCMMLSSVNTTQAQIAPDFTVTDINGNTHNLYTYIGQGKTVFLDFSTTWCGPCWYLHQIHLLDKANKLYGSEGSDDLVVLFIESDPNTTLADLQGTGTNTYGDWVTGVNYPIIDDASVGTAYNVNSFPTLIKVCQDTIMKPVNAYNVLEISALGAFLQNGSSCSTFQGVPNAAQLRDREVSACFLGGSTIGDTKFIVENLGNNPITEFTAELKAGDNVVATETFTANIAPSGTEEFSFQPLASVDPSATYTMSVTSNNSVAPYQADWLKGTLTNKFASESSQYITVEIKTDAYSTADGGSAWEIKDSNGNIVASGSDYGNNTTATAKYELPAGENCYSVHMHDNTGDGWGEGGLKIKSEGEYIFNHTANLFKDYVNPTAFRTSIVSSTEEIASSSWSIFPNPAKDIVHIEVALDQKSEVSLVDIHGRTLSTKAVSAGKQKVGFEVADLPDGVYFIQLISDKKMSTKKLTIQ